jgi:hypothetical protein
MEEEEEEKEEKFGYWVLKRASVICILCIGGAVFLYCSSGPNVYNAINISPVILGIIGNGTGTNCDPTCLRL